MHKDEVTSINQELRILHDEALRGHENPRLIKLVDCIIRLTNEEGDDTTSLDASDLSDPTEAERATPVAVSGVCKANDKGVIQHRNLNIWGFCNDCQTCTHANQHGGFCVTCGEPVPANTLSA